MRRSLLAALYMLLSVSAAIAAGAGPECPLHLTPDFPLDQLYRCTQLHRGLCQEVCGTRYEDLEVREAVQLRKGERALVCLDPSISVMKNGSPYSYDREKHGCYRGIEGHPTGGGGRTWCVQLNNVYEGRKLGAYLQCAARLDPDYVPQPAADGDRHTVMLLEDSPKTLRVGSESADDDQGAYRATGTAPVRKQGIYAAATAEAPKVGADVEAFGTNPFEKRIAESKMNDALAARGRLASAVRKYRADHGGQLPPDLAALVPDYFKALPEIEIPGYRKTRGVTVVKDAAGGELGGSVNDTGGWLYVSDGNSRKRGAVTFDSIKLYRGKPLYSY